MAKKPTTTFICQSCHARTSKWAGRCEQCGEWNTLEEETVSATPNRTSSKKAGRLVTTRLDGKVQPPERIDTSITELNRVLGGGIVPGSAVLVGGDPGIGKSTLMLQMTCALARSQHPVLYVSGEEAIDQIRLRAQRLELDQNPHALDSLDLAASINVADIAATLEERRAHKVVVIDSIQTMWLEDVASAPGSVSQVRHCAFELIRLAKTVGFSLVLIGHVTKEGALAGPRVLEHMVDAVLYFEGDRGHQFRILRGAKNRFGATDEIGVFAMTDTGLREVPNPSALFLAERRGNIAGSAVFAGLEGTRPVLLEVQVLLSAKSGDGAARRAVLGWDSSRLSMILAVLEARCGLKLGSMDVHLNVTGGLKISEPAADLAVAAALISAATGQPTAANSAYFGEIGLSGEVRQVPQAELRLKEIGKLGFQQAVVPRHVGNANARPKPPKGLALQETGHLSDLVERFAAPEKDS
ncbi:MULTISPECIES: DNA repair protein RadA [unclassified Saccharibacter]|uniref:DNA repair protein RadA n=1 Tax=unclassified Saccharibacter TaxID=2648722 RepID=UPI00132869F8|nr:MULTISPECIES: DNA repair protein RadA [unclassified Saccharibacter]MXV36492.1 DNA repair protein RadA [Saccharibacter sp. EH611]MXV57654.1 DNA repair protein RadA [Saccharibacter sp. EH70]MXV65039.1 DNA repair protein RadA [Saccharibacter sp. EH60]